MTSTAQLLITLTETANLFRLGQEASAAKLLRSCLDSLEEKHQNLLQTSEFNKVLLNALNAQSNQDWLGLADYLEFDIALLISHQTSKAMQTENK